MVFATLTPDCCPHAIWALSKHGARRSCPKIVLERYSGRSTWVPEVNHILYGMTVFQSDCDRPCKPRLPYQHFSSVVITPTFDIVFLPSPLYSYLCHCTPTFAITPTFDTVLLPSTLYSYHSHCTPTFVITPTFDTILLPSTQYSYLCHCTPTFAIILPPLSLLLPLTLYSYPCHYSPTLIFIYLFIRSLQHW